MKIGDRVTPRSNYRMTGTAIKVSGTAVTVKWDKANEQMCNRSDLFIIGHDPTVGDQTGVWRCPQEEKRLKMVAAFHTAC